MMPSGYSWMGTVDLEELDPLEMTLRGEGLEEGSFVPVHLETRVTEVGTIEVWCHSTESAQQWRLQFDLRAGEGSWGTMGESSFVVGIDLGTTNSVHILGVARRGGRTIQSLPIPQFTREGTVGELSLLPSFLYAPLQQGKDGDALPWDKKRAQRFQVGALARTQAGLLPSRVVQSAKSWLCHPELIEKVPFALGHEGDGPQG